MDDDTLEAYVHHYIAASEPQDETAFTWQGGEPTLPGLVFYCHAVALQAKYGTGRKISNSFQTNGVLLDDEWCAFLTEYHFLVGLSLDGPPEAHNRYRVTKDGRFMHRLTMRTLALLQKHRVGYNVLVCANHTSAQQPLQVYDFLYDVGVGFIQFIPAVEHLVDEATAHDGLKLHTPGDTQGRLMEWSVRPEGFGEFLVAIFDHWVKRDVGKIFVMNIEWALANFVDASGAVCYHRPACGRSMIAEYNGDVYACDHYAYPQYRLGNMHQQTIVEMTDSPQQQAFGEDKSKQLSVQCRSCNMLKVCWGGCPKHRFILDASGKSGLNYLYAGYQRYFRHLLPYLKAMADLLAHGRPTSDIMHVHLLVVSKQKSTAACG